jgi:glycerophosphoryl diester phosphodiesterase
MDSAVMKKSSPRRAVRVIAHRGTGQGMVESNAAPENTLPAFMAGWDTGAYGCELDVHVTSDGQVIVIHDSTTNRTTNASWVVADHTAEELLSLDAGRWKGLRWAGTRLPLLSEVLAIIPDGRRLYIELKDGPQVVPGTVEAVRASGKGPSQIVFISFDVDTIGAAKAALPDYQCLLIVVFQSDDAHGRWNVLYDEGPGFRTVTATYDQAALLELVRTYRLDGIDSSFVMPPSLVAAVAEAGLDFVTWTIDDPQIALDLVKLGVTAITTDRPKAIREALQAAGVQLA